LENKSKTIIVIPTYDEKENIEKIISAVFAVDDSVNILVVDDGSPDGTGQIVKNLMASDDRIHLLEREGKQGLGTAYCAGFAYALERDFDFIMEMDADFSHDPKEIPNFLSAIKDNDLVIGSRYISGVNVVNWPLKRLLLSYFANVYTQKVTGMKIKDATGGFKCFRADMLRRIDLGGVKTNGYGFQIEMNFRTWKLGGSIKEIPIIFVDRLEGQSKMSKDIIWEAVFLVWKLALGIIKVKKA
jgi:dolichol-phosphate mannosyltransferase